MPSRWPVREYRDRKTTCSGLVQQVLEPLAAKVVSVRPPGAVDRHQLRPVLRLGRIELLQVRRHRLGRVGIAGTDALQAREVDLALRVLHRGDELEGLGA